jgi:hypothetical protein
MGTLADWFAISLRVEGGIMFSLIGVMFLVSVLGFFDKSYRICGKDGRPD